MEEIPQEKPLLQWHPAFFAGIQIELEKEQENLIFENEHQLGTKPKGIDILIIKKERNLPVSKNIGRIFRTYNIIEYKSPSDYLSVDDFYQVYGYACFYKADSPHQDQIPVEEMTISLVCFQYPRKLIRHLSTQRAYTIQPVEPGIYYVHGDKIPIQIIVTSKLSEQENLWISNLTNHLTKDSSAEKLIAEFNNHKDNNLYQSIMDIILHANQQKFLEVKPMMCNALKELMKDELEESKKIGMEIGRKAGMEAGRKAGMEAGRRAGMEAGRKAGMEVERQAGMKLFIETCQEFGLTQKQTLDRILADFSLSPEQVQNYIDKYWKM